MPRIPSYRVHKGSGQGCTTIQGKMYYFGPYEDPKSKEKFRKLLGEWLASNTPSTFGVKASAVAFAELALDYLAFAKGYYSKSEYASSVGCLKPIQSLYADTLCKDFGPAELKACRQWWLESGASRQYANRQTSRLLRVLKWGVSESKVPVEVYQSCKCVAPLKRGRCQAPEAPPILPVADEVVEKTLEHLTKVVADMVRFQKLVGCRPGEVCQIKPCMVDRSNAVWEIRLTEHKSAWRGKDRTIYVGPKAQAILLPYLKRGSNRFCFDPSESEEQRLDAKHKARVTPLSCGNKPGSNKRVRPKKSIGKSFDTASYGRSIEYACRKAFPAPEHLDEAQIKAWHKNHRWAPNQLRHSRATELRKAYGIEAASLILGHAGLEVTQVYAERDRARALEIAMQVG